ncbi:hypothetical protein KKG22_01485 [Patescibacteria group bacterium]|nr:hypothetical protein [Patescibacteria group bacterium]MBU1721767.1 hypothetical protein [Patescibacteria group bacterium]MBU1901394.1 hypothetical protein [Patescibacteria group bacterium]
MNWIKKVSHLSISFIVISIAILFVVGYTIPTLSFSHDEITLTAIPQIISGDWNNLDQLKQIDLPNTADISLFIAHNEGNTPQIQTDTPTVPQFTSPQETVTLPLVGDIITPSTTKEIVTSTEIIEAIIEEETEQEDDIIEEDEEILEIPAHEPAPEVIIEEVETPEDNTKEKKEEKNQKNEETSESGDLSFFNTKQWFLSLFSISEAWAQSTEEALSVETPTPEPEASAVEETIETPAPEPEPMPEVIIEETIPEISPIEEAPPTEEIIETTTEEILVDLPIESIETPTVTSAETQQATSTESFEFVSSTPTASPSATIQSDKKEKKEKKEKKQPKQELSLELSHFTIQEKASTYLHDEFSNPYIMLSLAHQAISEGTITIEYKKKNTWKKLVTLSLEEARSNASNNDYFSYPLKQVSTPQELQQMEIRVTISTEGILPENMLFLDAIWIELEAETSDPAKNVVSFISTQKDFSLEDEALFIFNYDATKKQPSQSISLDEVRIEAHIYNSEQQEMTNIIPQIVPYPNNTFTVSIPQQQKREIPSGTYTLEVLIYEAEDIVIHQEDFTFGVLAVNTDKSIYITKDTAHIHMAALNADGHTLCDAQLLLEITAPNGNVSTPNIQTSGLCGPDNVIDVPDYFTTYTPTSEGRYGIRLTNLDTTAMITDFFDVKSYTPFDISRVGPTRIYPPADYPMEVTITVNEDFEGTFIEPMPQSFTVKHMELIPQQIGPTSSTPLTISQNSHSTEIRADVSWHAGDSYILSYTFDAPNISPYLFLLGPFQLDSTSNDVYISTTTPRFIGTFEESGQWHIASDAVGTIDPDGDGTSSCTPTPGGSDYTTVDDATRLPTTPDTSDYITCNDTESTLLQMTTLSNVGTATEIQVFAYHNNGNANMQWDVELWDSTETTQYGITQQLAVSTSNTWDSATFSSLSLTQSQLDGLRVKFVNTNNTTPVTSSQLYSTYATVTYTPANESPTVSNISLNGDEHILLTENTTTTVSATATITDPDGYSDISFVSAKMYRSGVGGAEYCASDENNCYEIFSCSLSNCSGNSCTATCSADIQFFAEPTDAGTPWTNEYWRVWIQAYDSLSQTHSGFSPVDTTDMSSLLAITVSDSTNFGALAVGEKNDPIDKTLTITSTGNISLDLLLFGTAMNSNNHSIPVGSRVYATSSIPFASSTILTNSPVMLELDIPKNTSTQNNTSTLWWGLSIPMPTAAGTYSGFTTYSATINDTPWP